MKPTETDLKIELTQDGGFVFRFPGEAPFYAVDREDLMRQLDEQIEERFEVADEEPDFDDDFDEDFGGGLATTHRKLDVEATDITDFGETISTLKGVYAMGDPRPTGNMDGDTVELGTQLQEKGITGLINLTERDYTAEQKEVLSSFGVEVHHFPVKDFTVPKMEDVNAIVKLTRNKDERYIIHCTAGKGRTGTIVGCIFVARSSQVTAEGAIDMIRKARPGSVETQEQKKFVGSYANFVDSLKEPPKATTEKPEPEKA